MKKLFFPAFLVITFFISNLAIASLLDLGGDYAHDSENVYFEGVKIEGADFNSFAYLGESYAKDKSSVYVIGYEIPGADPDSFISLGGPYAKDKNKVYAFGAELKAADIESFQVYEELYASDNIYAYFDGEIIPGVRGSEFEYLGGAYAKDKNFVFRYGRKQDQFDPNNFSYLGGRYTKDKHFIYVSGGKLLDADYGSFQYLKDEYAKDDNYVYFLGAKILEADPNSFEVSSGGYAKDSERFYLDGRVISGSEKPSFISKGFSDLEKDSLEAKAAEFLSAKGIIKGYPDGSFRGNNKVIRAEAVKFFLLAGGYEVPQTSKNYFNDVSKDYWFHPFTVRAKELGIIKGYDDGSFGPSKGIKRGEFLKMFTTTFNLRKNGEHSFQDIENTWVDQYGGVADKYALFPGLTNNLYFGTDMTRAEMAIAFYQYLNK